MTNWRTWCTLSGIPWHWVSLSCFASFHNMWSCNWLPIFQRSILPPSLRSRCFRMRMLSPSITQTLPTQILKEVKLIISKDMTVSSSCHHKTQLTVHNRAFSCNSEWSNSMSPNHLQKGCFWKVCSIIHSCYLPFLNKVTSSHFLYTLPFCPHSFTSYSPPTVLSDHVHQYPAYMT